MLQKTIALGKQLSKKEMRNVKGGACTTPQCKSDHPESPQDGWSWACNPNTGKCQKGRVIVQ